MERGVDVNAVCPVFVLKWEWNPELQTEDFFFSICWTHNRSFLLPWGISWRDPPSFFFFLVHPLKENLYMYRFKFLFRIPLKILFFLFPFFSFFPVCFTSPVLSWFLISQRSHRKRVEKGPPNFCIRIYHLIPHCTETTCSQHQTVPARSHQRAPEQATKVQRSCWAIRFFVGE